MAYTYAQALEKLKYFCAYQERSHSDVEKKLYEYPLTEEERENVIATLISENYLNEERFAIAFTEGKFRMKKWGKQKIKAKLKEKKVSEYCIRKGLEALEEEEYNDTLQELIKQKYNQTKANSTYQRKAKTARYCIQKGFEPALVWEYLNNLTTNNYD